MLLFTSAFAVLVGASSSSSSKTSTAGSLSSLIFIVLLGVLAYVFFIRPRSQQARKQRETLQELNVGDEILTGAGIFGRVLDVEPDRVTVETAPGTRITVLRSTVARRITEPPAEEAGWTDRDDEAWSQHEHEDALGPGETTGPEEGSAAAGDHPDEDDGQGASPQRAQANENGDSASDSATSSDEDDAEGGGGDAAASGGAGVA